MQPTPYLELEQDISRVVRAITLRDRRIAGAILTNLCSRFSPEEIAGILLVSLEQLLWLDSDAVVWAVEQLISEDILREMRQITSVTVGKQLINQGLVPGRDFSVDSVGNLLLNAKAKAAILMAH